MIKVDKDVIVYEENGEILLVHMGGNKFFALDEFSSILWKKIEEIRDFSLIVENLCFKYQEDYKVVEKDVREFVGQLKELGVIKVHG